MLTPETSYASIVNPTVHELSKAKMSDTLGIDESRSEELNILSKKYIKEYYDSIEGDKAVITKTLAALLAAVDEFAPRNKNEEVYALLLIGDVLSKIRQQAERRSGIGMLAALLGDD
ncbi:hypothetical protein CLV58_1064 [Spirosoma oryzae]|uniref:Uncharacterized protein n=1 Tax=Spirosoma oryzae TaxID=1469603 RepID=A0A2T0T5B4_9BACT|nr:hypothetical protein [Spirosoma oryzae]PRY40821.1 hypothetical protein CLV58_1064 [Spirosoma oryzae]